VMKSLQNFSKEDTRGIFLTPSEVIEYLYCPRFIYYMRCQNLSQHEEQRYKVIKGRQIHEWKKKINKEYLRKKLGVVKKEQCVYMSSEKYNIKGIVDEVLYLEDGSLAPLDYKFAKYREFLYKTHRIQSIMYALLIMDVYKKRVDKGYICYTRSNDYIKEIQFRKGAFLEVIDIINNMLRIIQTGYYPKKTSYKIRCMDCCYRNICV